MRDAKLWSLLSVIWAAIPTRRGQPTKRIIVLHHFRVAVGQVPPPASDYDDVVWRAAHDGLYRHKDGLFTVTSVDALLNWGSTHGR
jgi:hypothetical protein